MLDFITYNFEQYEASWHHKLLIEKLEAVERGEIKRLMVFMPPRHGKSEIISVQFPAWLIGRNPDRDIILASYSSDLAHDFGRQTRNLIASPEFTNIFTNVTLAEDSSAKGKWNTNGRGAYNAVGVGGALTGRGAHILIIDDPVKNRADAESQVYRDNTWSWYTSTARTRLSPDGAIIVVMTRWHDDDLAGRILKNGDSWEIINLPAIATQDEQFRKTGEPLWPTRFSIQNLLQTKSEIGSYDWSALYMQDPLDESTQEFKRSFFRYTPKQSLLAKTTSNYITIDTAISERDSADSTGIVRNYVDDQNKWNIKAYRMKISPTELIDNLFAMNAEDRPVSIGIEKTIYLQAIKPFLDDEMRRRNTFLPIVELQHNQTQKETRIRGLIPRYESGSIFHIEGETKELEDELLRFPKAVHDDVMDALAYQLQIAKPASARVAQIRYPTSFSYKPQTAQVRYPKK